MLRRFKYIASYVAATIVTALVIFCLLDWILGKFLNRPDYMRKPFPYVMFAGTPDVETNIDHGYEGAVPYKVRHNKFGFRGEPPTDEKPPNEFRIFVLGGSTVYNGAENASIPGNLQRLIGSERHLDRSCDIRVFNWGVVSSCSGQELAQILFRLTDLKPDMIIMYGSGNDLFIPLIYDPRPGYPYNFFRYENPLTFSNIVDSLFSHGYLSRRFISPLLTTYLELDDIKANAGYGSVEWKTTIVRTYLANVRKAKLVCDAMGIKFVCFLQPVLHYKTTMTEREKLLLGGPEFQNDIRELRGKLRWELKQAGKAIRDCVVDLSDTFNGCTKEVYWDFIHVYDKYNATIAKEMLKNIRPQLPHRGGAKYGEIRDASADLRPSK